MKRENVITAIGVLLIVAGVWMGVYAYKSSIAGRSGSFHSKLDLSKSEHLGGDFTLTSYGGKEVSLSDFKGKVVLIFFGYTFCPEICPTGLSDINMGLSLLGEDSKDVQVLFISVDPQRDTPQVLKDYVGEYNQAFIGLTGSDDQIRKVARQYAAAYTAGKPDADGDYDVGHSTHTSLVGRDGKIKNFIKYKTPASQLADMIREQI